jgi:hypothetical protein
MEKRAIREIAVGMATVGGAGAGFYLLAVRPWHLRWGATGAEVSMQLPGGWACAPCQTRHQALDFAAKTFSDISVRLSSSGCPGATSTLSTNRGVR